MFYNVQCALNWLLLLVAIDIDECAPGIGKCRQNHTSCTNKLGSFTCDCIAGYRMENEACQSKGVSIILRTIFVGN